MIDISNPKFFWWDSFLTKTTACPVWRYWLAGDWGAGTGSNTITLEEGIRDDNPYCERTGLFAGNCASSAVNTASPYYAHYSYTYDRTH